MAKKKRRKKKNRQKVIILCTAGVLVLAAAVTAGVLLYRNAFSQSPRDVLEEYVAHICLLYTSCPWNIKYLVI